MLSESHKNPGRQQITHSTPNLWGVSTEVCAGLCVCLCFCASQHHTAEWEMTLGTDLMSVAPTLPHFLYEQEVRVYLMGSGVVGGVLVRKTQCPRQHAVTHRTRCPRDAPKLPAALGLRVRAQPAEVRPGTAQIRGPGTCSQRPRTAAPHFIGQLKQPITQRDDITGFHL